MIKPRKFRTKEARRRERTRVAIRVGAIVTCVVCVLGGIVYAMHQPFARVQSFEFAVSGALEEADLAAVARAVLEGRHLGVLPKDFVLFPQVAYVEQALRNAFPRIHEVRVERVHGRALHVSVVERSPDSLWCGDVVPDIVQDGTQRWGTCYLLDDAGYVYDTAPSYSSETFVRFYGPLAHAHPVGQYLVESDEYRKWRTFQRAAQEYIGAIYAFLFVDERDVEVYRADGSRLIAPRNESVDVLIARLEALTESGTIDSERVVEYLDLRFGMKVFVKYRDTTFRDQSATSSPSTER